MNATELGLTISNYEMLRNIYMNFSVDSNGIWGLPEGDKAQHLLRTESIEDYRSFLEYAITHYTNMTNFFHNELDCSKKLKKYKLYLKRLDNAIQKYSVIKAEEVSENDLTIEEVIESWSYDEDNDTYWIDTESHGIIMYVPIDNIFIVHEGAKREFVTNINEVLKILKGA